MTLEELYAQRDAIGQEMLQMKDAIADTDAHALKCFKKGLNWAETYPEDAEKYNTSVARFNELETEMADVEAQIAEEEAKKAEPEEDPTEEATEKPKRGKK